MADATNIEWADSTFNPWMGCTKISPACDHCYAEELMDKRMGKVRWGAGQPRVRTSASNWRKPLQWNRADGVHLRAWEAFQDAYPGLTDEELQARGFVKPRRRRVFCASLADVFDNEVNPAWRRDLFDLIEQTPNLDWLLLTKRIGNAARMIEGTNFPSHRAWPWPNVWLGATICNQDEADRDIPKLLAVPAKVRFLSIEPMLGPIDLAHIDIDGHSEIYPLRGTTGCEDGDGEPAPDLPGLDWVIVGGESGQHARPMHPDWVRGLRDQCANAGVPFLFKQWGEWGPSLCGCEDPKLARKVFLDGTTHPLYASEYGCKVMTKVGKKAAGRLLDGCEHNGYPEAP